MNQRVPADASVWIMVQTEAPNTVAVPAGRGRVLQRSGKVLNGCAGNGQGVPTNLSVEIPVTDIVDCAGCGVKLEAIGELAGAKAKAMWRTRVLPIKNATVSIAKRERGMPTREAAMVRAQTNSDG